MTGHRCTWMALVPPQIIRPGLFQDYEPIVLVTYMCVLCGRKKVEKL